MSCFSRSTLSKTVLFVGALVVALVGAAHADGGGPLPDSGDEGGFVFTAVGDFGSEADGTATLEVIAQSGASLHLALGDLSRSDTVTESDWCALVKSQLGDTFPFEVLAGNHEDDTGGDGHIRNFAACLPDRIGVTGDYGVEYYADYLGLVRFILISPDLTVDDEYYYYGEGNAHYQWLESAIDGARAAEIPWVVVGMHKTCVSMGVYYCSIYQDAMDLLVDRKVDLVLQAHDHTYQRSRQLSVGPSCPQVVVDSFDSACMIDEGADDSYLKGAGTVFVSVGTGGAPLYDIDPSRPDAGYVARAMGANAHPRKGALRFAVTSTSMSAEFLGSTDTSDFTDSFAIRSTSSQ